MSLELLADDLRRLCNRHPDIPLLFGLYECASALSYKFGGKCVHWMVFYMMDPAWRAEDDE